MAAAPISLLEAVAMRVLIALGVGVAADVASDATVDAVRERQEEADKAKSTPIARAETQTKTKTKCQECAPDCGQLYQRNFPVRKDWVDYQARITGMPSGPTFIMEWEFNGVKFDGFVSADCLLQDAKAGYDQFFNEWGEFRYDFQRRIFSDMMDDAVKQNLVAVPKPPVRLRWYFMESVSYRYMQKILQLAAPEIEVVFQP